jgi:hypothetical protein
MGRGGEGGEPPLHECHSLLPPSLYAEEYASQCFERAERTL